MVVSLYRELVSRQTRADSEFPLIHVWVQLHQNIGGGVMFLGLSKLLLLLHMFKQISVSFTTAPDH